jgi:hypothetical protein
VTRNNCVTVTLIAGGRDTILTASKPNHWVMHPVVRVSTNIYRNLRTQQMKMFVILDKARPHTENIRGLNLAAVTCTTVQVSKLPY